MIRRRTLFRCDAGALPEIGTGHLVRCLLLAEMLRERGAEAFFCGQYDRTALARITEAGFDALEADDSETEAELLHRAVVRRNPQVVVVDRLDTAVEDLAAIREMVPAIVTLDDLGPGASVADLVVNAIVGDGRDPYSSYEYLAVPPPERTAHVSKGRPNVVVSLGGYDHGGIGEQAAHAVAGLDARVIWIVRDADAIRAPEGVAIIENPPDFSALLRGADIAVVNGGLTLFEAVANGVPSVAVPQYAHQAHNIERLARRDAVVPVQAGNGDVGGQVQSAVARLIGSPDERQRLRRNALEAIDGLGIKRLGELIRIVEPLAWDTQFFGVPVARIYPHQLTERMLSFALDECERWGSECVYYLCDCHHAESVRLVEAAGFHFVDIRLTFERSLEAAAAYSPDARDAVEDDIPQLREIARRLYVHSRYFFDRQFPRADCERFYADWIAKCVRGELADRVFVIDGKEGPLGYVAVGHESPVTSTIVLFGVTETARGQRVGPRLLDHAFAWAREEGYSRMEVVTQGRNYEGQRAYQRAGFITRKTELWYHLWRR